LADEKTEKETEEEENKKTNKKTTNKADTRPLYHASKEIKIYQYKSYQ